MGGRGGFRQSSQGGYTSSQLSDYAEQQRKRRENARRIRDQRSTRMESEAFQRGAFGQPPPVPSDRRRVQPPSDYVPPGSGSAQHRHRSTSRDRRLRGGGPSSQPSSMGGYGGQQSGYSGGGGGGGYRGGSGGGYNGNGRMLAPRRGGGPSSAPQGAGAPGGPAPGGYGQRSVRSADINARQSERQVLKRVQSLEEQLKLLRHQQRLFISFMQTANQKFIHLEGELKKARASAAAAQQQQQQQQKRVSSGYRGGGNDGRISPELSDGRSSPDYLDYNAASGGGSASAQPMSSKPRFQAGAPAATAAATPKPHSARRRQDAANYAKSYSRQQEQEQQEQQQRQTRFDQAREAPSAAPTSYDSDSYAQGPSFDTGYEQTAAPAAEGGPDPYAEPVHLEPCPHCGRKFKPDVLARHVAKQVCQKKRKVYNVKRVTEKVKTSKSQQRKYQAAKEAKQSKWRKDRDALRQAMKQGRMVSKAIKEGRDLSTLPAAAAPVHDDRVPCPHCGRKFNADVADRHIPRCKNIKAKPKRLVSKRTSSKYGGLHSRGGSRR